MSGVEYRETEVFELFPKFEYTREQRKRVVLFHGYTRNYRKLIRYARNFDENSKICLVYLVGEIKAVAIEKELVDSGCSDRVCVIHGWFPKEKMGVWERYNKLRKIYKASGGWDDERDAPSERALCDEKKLYEYYCESLKTGMDGQTSLFTVSEDHDLCRRMVREYEERRRVIREYEKLKGQCGSVYFKTFRIYRVGKKPKPYTHEGLNRLIRSIYPFGAEGMGAGANSYISPAYIPHSVRWALDGEQNKRLGLTQEMIAPAVKHLVGLIKTGIGNNGYISLQEIHDSISLPPFGLSYDGFSAAVFVSALRHFGNRTLLYYDGCNTFHAKNIMESVFCAALDPSLRMQRIREKHSCLYLESQPHKKVKQFMHELWGIKIEMPGTSMSLHLCQRLCGVYKVPLSYVDKRLLSLTLWNVNFWDKAGVSGLAEEIGRHGDEILDAHKRYIEENEHIPDYAKSMMVTDYSWAWDADEYADILWQTEKYGPWPWDLETHRAVRRETEERRRNHGYQALCMV